MSARGIVTSLAGTAVSAVRHPFRTTGRVVGGAKVVVATGTSVAGSVAGSAAKSATSHLHPVKEAEELVEEHTGEESGTPDHQSESAQEHQEPAGDASATTDTAPAPEEIEPQVVLREPGPPLEPPIDVVGEALAAEGQEPTFGGHATEPKATTRDEEHGDAALQRAEAEEIAEELVEAFPAGEVGIETPVGTTGADVGHNPDTAEADLQQPGTAPLVDDATVKAVVSETKTARKSARTKKS